MKINDKETTMFGQLFKHPKIIAKYQNGSMREERLTVLEEASEGHLKPSILQRIAIYGLVVAMRLAVFPPDKCFTKSELSQLAGKWGARQPRKGRKQFSKLAKADFLRESIRLLKSCHRLVPEKSPLDKYNKIIADYFQEKCHFAKGTRKAHLFVFRNFVCHLGELGIELSNVTPEAICSFLEWKRQTSCPNGMKSLTNALRSWLSFLYRHGYACKDYSVFVMSPAVGKNPALPYAPDWQVVEQLVRNNYSHEQTPLRNTAIMLLLATYSLRPCEVTGLLSSDIDWHKHTILIRHTKNGRNDIFPLDVRVGNAIYRYAKEKRPKVRDNHVFIRAKAPYASLTSAGIFNIVSNRFKALGNHHPHHGPYALRHAGAMHLLKLGFTFKAIGDHLGHNAPQSTQAYARMNLDALRIVHVSMEGLS
jgi:site-specific recombinase XerD